MADDIIVQDPPQQAAPVVDPAKAALDAQMAMAGVIPKPAAEPATVIDNAQQAAATTTTQEPPAPVDYWTPIKEKFAYQSHEDAIKEIEQLRALKDAPPTYEFENEESKKLFTAFSKGDRKEVFKILEKQERIEQLVALDVTKDTAADIVKYGMSIKYPNLTQDEINYRFNKQYGTPPKPVQYADEEATEYQNRVAEWEAVVSDKNMDLVIEAKLSKPELAAAKSKITFPDIQETTDENYLQYQKELEEQQRLAVETREAYKTFTPKSIATTLNFKDEPNKIDFQFQYEPDNESFSKTVEMTSDINLFWNQFKGQDGKPDRQKFLDAMYFATNKEKILISAMTQAKNAAIKAMLPDNTQAGGLVRQITQTQETSELHKKMEQALKGYM